jgi:putative MATE family efflux protein
MSEISVAEPDAAPPGRRHRHNLTKGPIGKTLFMFALPVLGGNALQNLNATVNAFWVSHTLGVSAVTAISNANLIMFLLIGSVFGISMAANILIAQSFGAKNTEMVKKVIGTSTTFFLAASLLLAVFGNLLAPQILQLMGTPLDARAEAIAYLRVVFTATPFMYFFAFIQQAQRGGGDSKTPFYFMILAVVLDSTLNPLLIRGIGPFPRLGIAGSSTATLIGQGVSLICMLVFLYRKKSHLLLRFGELHLLKPDWSIMKSLLLRGLPMGVQMIVMSLGGMMMIGLVNRYGSTTTAAFGAAQQVWTYVQMPAMALSASVSSMAAQNVGAQLWDRVGRVAWIGVLQGLAVTTAMVVVLYLLGDQVLSLFLPPHSNALPIGSHINVLVLWSFALFSITFTVFGVVRATGAVWAPLLILIISNWVIRIPFAWLLTPMLGADAIWWSFPLGSVVSAVLAIAYYRWGGWRNARMIAGEPTGEAPQTGSGLPIMDDEVDEGDPLPAM